MLLPTDVIKNARFVCRVEIGVRATLILVQDSGAFTHGCFEANGRLARELSVWQFMKESFGLSQSEPEQCDSGDDLHINTGYHYREANSSMKNLWIRTAAATGPRRSGKRGNEFSFRTCGR